MDSVIFLSSETVIMLSQFVIFILSPAVFAALFFVTAPWGRHEEGASPLWGFRVPPMIAWLLQELPNFVCLIFFVRGAQAGKAMNAFLLSLFLIHYVNRTFIFPFRARLGRGTPLSIMLFAAMWTLLNGVLQGLWLGSYAVYDADWATHPQFLLGVVTFVVGMYLNVHSDELLMQLRKPGDKGYYIPSGALFDYVTASNYFAEWMEWCGFALACNSWPAVAFAVFTFANLSPRAHTNHRWYQEKFGRQYPPQRKAFLPFLW